MLHPVILDLNNNSWYINNLDINSVGLINDTFIEHTENEGIIIFSSHFDPDLRNLETIQLS